MTEEELNVSGATAQDNGTMSEYLATIKQLKENSVSKAEYEKLQAENKQIFQAYVNGQYPEKEVETEPVDIDELRSNVFKKEHNNLEYWKDVLALRDGLISNGEKDPFLPYGEKIVPTNEDIECANRVAEVVRECIEYAEGDSEIFTNELQRRTVDTYTGPKRR